MSGITITVAIAKPVVIQVISWTVAPTAPRICGSATFTIDESIAPISVPKVTETVTSHLFVGARVARRPWAGRRWWRSSRAPPEGRGRGPRRPPGERRVALALDGTEQHGARHADERAAEHVRRRPRRSSPAATPRAMIA